MPIQNSDHKRPAVTLPPALAKEPQPALPPSASDGSSPAPSKVEKIKKGSQGLRGGLKEQASLDTDHFQDAETQLLKFHGVYQQDDRDNRKGGKEYIFMTRSRLPGGRLSAEQYLAHEQLADTFGNGTLRVTTRQAIQLHGVIKGNLQQTLRTLNEQLVTTLGACGDVVRNVMCCPVPSSDPLRREIETIAQQISDRFLPTTSAYHEIWLDGEKAVLEETASNTPDPIYGQSYLPRKFKIGIAFPGDNCVDVYTHDVGLIPVVEEGVLKGFNVIVGGGLGMTHKKPSTFPRLGDPLAFAPKKEIIGVIEAIVAVQRDHGDRSDRKHARMKYLIHDWGLERFRREVETRLGRKLLPPAPAPPLEHHLHLGWNRQADGFWHLGVSIENGRIQDEGDYRLKSGLHEIIATLRPGIRLTPNQDMLLTGIRTEDRPLVDSILQKNGVLPASELSTVQKLSIACPAMPTCGLAITESERVLPQVIDEMEYALKEIGLDDEPISVRMTGCPNGCARPYVSDIGFVGRSLNQYTVFLGGQTNGTRLNRPYRDLVPLEELVDSLRPLFLRFKEERADAETFGDYCDRIGIDALREYTSTVEVPADAR